MNAWVRRLVVAAALVTTFSGQAAIAQALVIGMPDYVGGTAYGVLADRTMAELARRSGIGITLRTLPPVRAVEAANDGEIDGEVARILDVAARYPNLEPLAISFSTLRLVVYASATDIVTRTRAQLRRQRLGVQRGAYFALKSTAGLSIIEAGSLEAMFALLREGRVEAIVVEQVSTADFLSRYPQPGVYRWPHAWAAQPLYTLIHKKHTTLLPRLNAAAQQMQRDGVIDRLNDEALSGAQIEALLPEPPAR